MKKQLLSISIICLFVSSINAQITITTADVITPTKTLYQCTDTAPTISIGPAGTNQTWNMSTLSQHSIDTLTFLPYSAAPNSKFSTANIAVKQGYQDFYTYLKNSSGSLTSLGNGGILDLGNGPTPVNQVNTPSEILMNFPATYNTGFTSNYVTRATAYYGQTIQGFPVDSVRQTSSVKKTVLVDAWGSITTPMGTFNALRSMETKISHDTIDAYAFFNWNNAVITTADSTVSYIWWTNGVGFPLVTATMDSSGAVADVQWLKSMPIGIHEYVAAIEINIYPNPAQNEITFSMESANVSSIQIFDIAGRIVDSYKVSNDKMIINTSQFSNGAYTYTAIGENNMVLRNGKFTIAK
jgi:hypothetical protein